MKRYGAMQNRYAADRALAKTMCEKDSQIRV